MEHAPVATSHFPSTTTAVVASCSRNLRGIHYLSSKAFLAFLRVLLLRILQLPDDFCRDATSHHQGRSQLYSYTVPAVAMDPLPTVTYIIV